MRILLLCRVRQLVYQRPSRQIREDIDESSRLEYYALKAYLTKTDRNDFLALFRKLKPRFAIYEQFVNNIIHLIIHIHRQSSTTPSTRSPEDSWSHGQANTVARALLTNILRHEKGFNRDFVHNFVARPEYTILYLWAIKPSPAGL